MNLSTALNTLKILADGMDIDTGEVIERNVFINEPDVLYALKYLSGHYEKKRLALMMPVAKTLVEKQQANITKGLPQNTGLPWTEDDDKALPELYRSGLSPKEIGQVLERGENAIFARLLRRQIIQEH